MTVNMKTEKAKKIDYDKFIEQVKDNNFKVDEVDYDEIIRKMRDDAYNHPKTKRNADRYNVPTVFNLFEEMCRQEQRIITMKEYIDRYMFFVNSWMSYGYVSNLHYEEKAVYKNIMKLRGYSSYRSALAEIGLKLMLEELDENYIIHMNEDTDQILGVDIVVETESDAKYIHVTKLSNFSTRKLESKSKKKVEVFNYNTQKFEEYYRDFTNHIVAYYDDTEENCDIVNGVYIFKKEYIIELLKNNEGLCDIEQLKYLESVDLEQNVEWIED